MWRACAAMLAVSVLVGCSSSKPGPASQSKEEGKKLEIAVIPKAATDEFWKSVHAGAARAEKELGNVHIIWKGPTHNDNREEQANLVDDFVTQHVDGVCLAPIDSQSLVSSASGCKNANIPVVIFDSALDEKDLYISYVATDNYNGGVVAAREMGKRLKDLGKPNGKVILFRYSSGSESTEQRERGFLETLQKEFPQIKVISSDQYSGVTLPEAVNKANFLLINFGNDVDGIFAVNETSAHGMLNALKDKGLAGKVVYIGFDASSDMLKALQDKEMQAIVLQDPVNMGYLAVKTMVAHLKGEPVEKRISTGENVATLENIDEPKIKKLLSPDQFHE